MRNILSAVLAVLMLVVSGTGCATFNRLVTNHSLITMLAVERGTAKVLHDHPEWQASVVRITEKALLVIDDKAVTDLLGLELYIKSQINWTRLLPGEQEAVNQLIAEVRQELVESFLARNIENPLQQMVEVAQVMTWIHDAAEHKMPDLELRAGEGV